MLTLLHLAKAPELLIAFVAGWLALLFVKYFVIGVQQWDIWFHPNRLLCDVAR